MHRRPYGIRCKFRDVLKSPELARSAGRRLSPRLRYAIGRSNQAYFRAILYRKDHGWV